MNLKRFLLFTLSLCFINYFSSCSSSEETVEKEDTTLITPTLESNFNALKSARLQVNINSGKINWTGDDQLLVFVHESGKQPTSAEGWRSCKYKFVTNSTDCNNNKFTQETNASHTLLLDPKKSYDWYVMYPYNETVTSPVGHGSFTIANPTMDQNHPTAHLATFDLMGNVKKGLKAENKVSLTLNHFATLMLFTVHNQTAETLLPQSMDFETTATGAVLSGDFTVDFEKGLTVKNGSNQMHLGLTGFAPIAPNNAFTVSTIMAPFSMSAGDQFNIRVVTDKSNTLQSSTMKGNIFFNAGAKSSANVRITPAPIINQDLENWGDEDIEGWGDQGHKDDVIM